jgi:hypothetical protein
VATMIVIIAGVSPCPVSAGCPNSCITAWSECADYRHKILVECNRVIDDKVVTGELTHEEAEPYYQVCDAKYQSTMQECDNDYDACCAAASTSGGSGNPTDPSSGGEGCCYEDGWCPAECSSCIDCTGSQQ